MKSARSFFIAAAATALLVTACSQPNNLQTPSLEAQFGTSGNDAATAVSVAANGIVTKAVELNRQYNEEEGIERVELQLRQLSANAALVRQISIGKFQQNVNLDLVLPTYVEVRTDKQGNIYALTSGKPTGGSDIPFIVTDLYKYGSGSAPVWKKTSSEIYSTAGFDLDVNGNVFVAQTNRNAATGDPTLSYFTRYNTNGVKWYQRNSKVGVIQDIEVAANGDIYIIGEKGLSRYNNSGGLIWTKAIPGYKIAVSPSAIYLLQSVKQVDSLIKLDLNGMKAWTQAGDGFTFYGDLETDPNSNVYLKGIRQDTTPDFVRKLNASGNYLWETMFDFGGKAYADYQVYDIATYDGSSIFAVGSTDGSVNGAYRGGASDGFIVRLNAQGQKVWER